MSHKPQRKKSKKNGMYSSSSKTTKNDEDDDKFEQCEESLTRIWVCSWNMAAKDHFKWKTTCDGRKIADDDQIQKFEQIIPTNYDLYIFGVQEGVSDTFFEYISLYLKEFEVQRFPLSNSSGSNVNGKNKKSLNKNANCFGVHGRGDGSFISTKFTGLAVYYRKSLKPYISIKSQAAISVGITQGSKGAACVLLKIYSTTVVFLSTHMSSNSTDAKLEHFKILVNKTGDALGCQGFDLLQQFHHIVWFGDLNYRITTLTADNVLQKMALGNLEGLWEADSLKQELKNRKQCAFKNFKEPKPRLDFYPTYKKKPNRQLDFDQNPKELRNMSASSQQSSLSQLDKIYTTKYKEPFYKGGLIQDRIPSFCDRVLYHTLDKHDESESLYPEPDTGVLNCVEFSYKKDKCNNYGCIPHHLMGSDHSAIYCGLQLRSPLLLPCPPHEYNAQGQPKSYQLKIEDIKILKKSPYHSDSTYTEYPIKTRICFPAPYEIENKNYPQHKPYAHTISQSDLEMYHSILHQIQAESKRRLSQQQGFNEVKRNFNRHSAKNTPSLRAKRQTRQKAKPLNLMDPEDASITHNQDALINAKPVVDKGLRSKKMVKKRGSADRRNSDDWGDSIPTADVLTNVELENQTKRRRKKKEMRANSIGGLHGSNNTKSQPQTKSSKTPRTAKSPNSMFNKKSESDMDLSDSEYFPDLQPDDIHQIRLTPNITPNAASRRDSAPNANKRQSPSHYIYRSQETTEQTNNKKKHPLPTGPPPHPPKKDNKMKHISSAPTSPADSGHHEQDHLFFNVKKDATKKNGKNTRSDHMNKKRSKKHGGLQSDNPLIDYIDSTDDEEPMVDPSIIIKKAQSQSVSESVRLSQTFQKVKSSPNLINASTTSLDLNDIKPSNNKQQQQQQQRKQKGLDGTIHEDYFDAKNDEYAHKVPITEMNKGSSSSASSTFAMNDIESSNNNRGHRKLPSKVYENSLQRTRSKSVGSFAETLDNKQTPHSPQRAKGDEYSKNNHNLALSGQLNANHNGPQISSPIYKDLAEMSKRLTLITFGPSRRPTHGNIHCVFRVETNDFKGQACIAFEWSDFAKEVEYTQYAELFHHGIPLYDKTGAPIRLKIHYKLSLIDKQIVFDYH